MSETLAFSFIFQCACDAARAEFQQGLIEDAAASATIRSNPSRNRGAGFSAGFDRDIKRLGRLTAIKQNAKRY
jgi:hypothetical protein